MKVTIKTLFLLGLSLNIYGQTDVAITEFRYNSKILDIRARPSVYFLNSSNFRQEIFIGIKLNKKTTLFNYSQYNFNNRSFRTGFRLDYKFFLNKVVVNNQLRYLNSINNKESNFFAYINDFFIPILPNLKMGPRSFFIYTDSGNGFKKRNNYIGLNFLYSRKDFSLFLNYLPDTKKNNKGYLFLIMSIIKLN